jgi:hypothetical protein
MTTKNDHIVGTLNLEKALRLEGFELPEQTMLVELICGVDSAMILRIEQFVTADDLHKISRALARLAEEA